MASKKLVIGCNDLKTTNPELISEWNFVRNKDLRMEDVTVSTLKKVWWICEKGHEWEAAIASRTRGSGCPICANKKVLKGYNDLKTLYPILCEEWHPTKNGYIKPDAIVAGSTKKFWWRCKEGHEWQASVVNRTKLNAGCPYCSGNKILEGVNDFATLQPNLMKEWHPTRNTVEPTSIGSNSGRKIWWKCEKGHEWEARVANRVRGSRCPICSKSNNDKVLFFDVLPELLSEYDSTLNSKLSYNTISLKSAKIAVWKCRYGHTWEASFANRSKGSGCPYCSGSKAIPDKTDLQTINPILAKEWHPTKNGALTPEKVTANSSKKVWWLLPYDDSISGKHFDFEWEASIGSRNKGAGCPFISGHQVWRGYNDLETINPKLAKEWHPTKNGQLLPSQVTKAYATPVWWLCSKGHEWQATVAIRNGKDTLCPYCTGMKVVEGETDLLTLSPDVAAEWNYERNYPLLPNKVTAQSGQLVWWKCALGHEWQAEIKNRYNGRNCPVCANKQVLKGYNDLATTHPGIAKEWHPTKNAGLSPTQVTAGAGNTIWWQCSCGHEWKTTIFHRLHGTGCPICYSEMRVSFPEKAVFFYVRKVFPDAEENYTTEWLGRSELDIAIPNLKIGIEYDGQAWHTNPERDCRKDLMCEENNYLLIRIRERDCPDIKSHAIVYKMQNNKNDLPTAIQFVVNQICENKGRPFISLDIDIERDREEISKLIKPEDMFYGE